MEALDDKAVDELITKYQATKHKNKIVDEIFNKYDLKTKDSLTAFCFVLRQIGCILDEVTNHLFCNEYSKKLKEQGHNFSSKIDALYFTFSDKLKPERIAEIIYDCVERSKSSLDRRALSLNILYNTNLPESEKEKIAACLKNKYHY